MGRPIGPMRRKSGDRPADKNQACGNRDSMRRLSREEPEVKTNAYGLLACYALFSACLSAAAIKGKVVDPSGAPVPGAEVSIVSRTGVEAHTVSAPSGGFELNGPDV